MVLYIFDKTSPQKAQIAFDLIKARGFLSSQVLFECLFVGVRKLKLQKTEAIRLVRFLSDNSYLQPENDDVVEKALLVFGKHLLQLCDSKIVAAALVADCTTLYSEDMQHGLVIEDVLTIVNPFSNFK